MRHNGEVFIGGNGVWSLVDPETVGQFTGLKDKNGIEIYDGDVVRMQQIQGIGEFIGVIHIGADPARPYDCRVWVDTSHEEKARKHGIGGKYVFIHNEPEVIGNIHEHRNLLTPQTT